MSNKKDLIKKMSNRTLYTQAECKILFEALFDIISEEVISGEDVSIVNFGKFFVFTQKPRPVRNPKTGEEMILAPDKVVKFKLSQTIKKKLKINHED
ncbi:HU family DNA-binding protein [bacterium]|nr:HU family DNA-binding protein [bacterium]